LTPPAFARRGAVIGVVALAGLVGLAGCDGLFTGDSVARFPLTQSATGGYAPIRVSLGPEMNPVALNLHVEYAASATEAGKWNSYRAVLTRAGAPIASREFRVNNTSDPMSPSAQVVSTTMLVMDVKEVADYELAIEATAPVAVTLIKPQLELRKNIRRQEK
jgi:hypothetical protein